MPVSDEVVYFKYFIFMLKCLLFLEICEKRG